ncbi:MAG TPA: class I SAM-dependent methyltransferase [Anaerolineales bacterium]|nr:class I SAM-dependent methyltransferase [Anaerolineales bacterium]
MSISNDWKVPGTGAEIYETVFVPAMMGEWAPRVIALANPRPGENVLDVACGTGALTRVVAQSIGPSGRVVGLDLIPEMLSEARNIPLDPSNAVPIEWREGDVNVILFENETFDIVFCNFGLMFFPNRVAALKEMRRVLKLDGRLALAVWGSIAKCPGQMAMKESWKRHFTEDAGLFDAQHSLGDPETVLSLIHDAGFRDVSVQAVMGVVRLPSPGHLARSYGAMAGIQADEKNRTEVIDEVSAALQFYVGVEGLEYPIEAILAKARK